MTAGERLRGWLKTTGEGFAGQLGGWIAESFKSGMEKSMDFLEPDLRAEIKPSLLRIRNIPGVPDDLKSMLDKTAEEPKAVQLLAILPFLVGILIGFGMQVAAPIARVGSYMMDKLVKSARIDPMQVITAWRRDPATYNQWFDDLKDLGWSDERIEVLKFATQAYPALADVIRFYAKEAFEPDMIAIYGLRDELPPYPGTLFEKLGVPAEIAELYWIAHWEHASWIQVIEMLRRGQLTEAEVERWYRVVEIPPFWRDKLTAISWEVPTRVDVRRWWDMRTVDEARLRQIYTAQGYHDQDLEDYVLWTKVYTAFPDLIARWSKSWITLDEVRSELVGMGMPAARVEEMLQTKIKAETPERTAKERDFTKSDIIKGVKTAVITRTEGEELLVDMGFDMDEAVYILEINIPLDEEDVVVRQRELSKTDIFKAIKLGTITSEEGVAKLVEVRYSPTDARFLVDLTIKSKDLTKSDILKKFREEIITEARALTMLQEEGFSAEEAAFLLTQPPEEEIVVAKGREASKADIVLGVKNGLITPETAYIMLQDIGFTPEASAFILAVRAETSPFSPVNFAEFKDRSQKYRVAAGMEAKPMPEEIKTAAAEVVRLTGEVEALELSIKEEERGLIDQDVIPEETTKRLKSLQVKRNRAISKLEKAKSEYDRLVAEWKHGLP